MTSTYRGVTIPAYADSADAVAMAQSLVDGLQTRTAEVNAQTGTTYTPVAGDSGKLVTLNNAAAVTVTVPNAVFAQGQGVTFLNKGAGTVTFAAGSGATLNGGSLTLVQYESGTLVYDSASVAYFNKGGGLPKAAVSGTTGSPTVDTTSRPGKTIYKFTNTAGGTITIGTAGVVEVLVVGGGGCGGYGYASTVNRGGGGGGGGQVVSISQFYMAAGAHTVKVGAGGTTSAGVGVPSGLGRLMAMGGGKGGDTPWETIRYGTPWTDGANGGGGVFNTNGGVSIPGDGYAGGKGSGTGGGGGAGAGAVGGTVASSTGGTGGAGVANSITGSSVTYAGGGGGGGGTPPWTPGAGGAGGGGGGGGYSSAGTAGTANTGGGGGGGGAAESGAFVYAGGAGGSGIVIVVVG